MASDSARLRNDQLQDFKYMMRLPYDIRRQIWLYLVPDEDWKLNRHAECFHDVLYGVDFGSLAKFKKQYPSPYNSLAACPESRRIGLEIMKRKFDEIEERMIWKNRSSKSTAFESHPVHGSTSALTIDARGSLVFSIDGDLDGARYYGQNLDDLVYWEWKEDSKCLYSGSGCRR